MSGKYFKNQDDFYYLRLNGKWLDDTPFENPDNGNTSFELTVMPKCGFTAEEALMLSKKFGFEICKMQMVKVNRNKLQGYDKNKLKKMIDDSRRRTPIMLANIDYRAITDDKRKD